MKSELLLEAAQKLREAAKKLEAEAQKEKETENIRQISSLMKIFLEHKGKKHGRNH